MTSKKIDLGEYVIKIYHNDMNGELRVDVFDEGGDVIESIYIINDEDEDDEEDEHNPIANLN